MNMYMVLILKMFLHFFSLLDIQVTENVNNMEKTPEKNIRSHIEIHLLGKEN